MTDDLAIIRGYGLDPHNVPLPKLKAFCRDIEKLHKSGGGYERFLKLLKVAIETHPDAKPAVK